MNFLIKFYIKATGRLVGEDEFGNSYYESSHRDWLGRYKRSVIYNGLIEATKIQPNWFCWLHHQIDKAPASNEKTYSWQKARLPNLTGTKNAYFPPLHLKSGKRKEALKQHYQAWRPN